MNVVQTSQVNKLKIIGKWNKLIQLKAVEPEIIYMMTTRLGMKILACVRKENVASTHLACIPVSKFSILCQ